MTVINKQEPAFEILCRTAIEQNLGDISNLPEELLNCVLNVYRAFMTCYLNILRQNENRPADWIPATVTIDVGLTDQMRHFFSDYQHITKKFYELNQDMEHLRAMDKGSHLKLYQFTIDKIIERCEPQDTGEARDEKSA
jgi:hypothetical protein